MSELTKKNAVELLKLVESHKLDQLEENQLNQAFVKFLTDNQFEPMMEPTLFRNNVLRVRKLIRVDGAKLHNEETLRLFIVPLLILLMTENSLSLEREAVELAIIPEYSVGQRKGRTDLFITIEDQSLRDLNKSKYFDENEEEKNETNVKKLDLSCCPTSEELGKMEKALEDHEIGIFPLCTLELKTAKSKSEGMDQLATYIVKTLESLEKKHIPRFVVAALVDINGAEVMIFEKLHFNWDKGRQIRCEGKWYFRLPWFFPSVISSLEKPGFNWDAKQGDKSLNFYFFFEFLRLVSEAGKKDYEDMKKKQPVKSFSMIDLIENPTN